MQDAPARPFFVHAASSVHVAGSSNTDILYRRSTNIECTWKVLRKGGRSDRWTLEEVAATEVEARVVAWTAGLLWLLWREWRESHHKDNDLSAGSRGEGAFV